MKPIRFLGDSLERLRKFPEAARREAGYALWRLQRGLRPSDTKPMPAIGPGVEEIRIRQASGAYRVVYLARRPERIYVLHAFVKKRQATGRRDLDVARKRYDELKGEES
ncbi:MAG: type II toxin-antitoxin system RelE/ParE family toxin [Terriglobales bacterium]